MTVVNPKSISGINSITTGSGSDNLLTIHTNDGTERVRVDSTGTTKIVTGIVTTLTATTGIVTTLTTNTLTANSTAKVGSGVTLSPDGDVFVTGVTTSTTVKVGGGVTISESGIEASGIGITCASINGGQISGRRNLITNGAMMIAQRSTDVTDANSGYHTVDRIQSENVGADEAPRRQQVDVSSASTPYSLGFRKAYKLTNGNQTGGAGVQDIMNIRYQIEGQDIVNSGWNYKSASSFVTLQFWIKSSVSQNFNMYLRTRDGTNQTFAFDTGTLSADTWTKIIKTIPGNSNIEIDNDNGTGLQLNFGPLWGTDRTDNSVTNDVWQAYNSAARMKDNDTTWYTTNDATLELTGLQLEVGAQATPFEHRSFGEEINLCKRYFQKYTDLQQAGQAYQAVTNGNGLYTPFLFQPEMRAAPTITLSDIQDGGSNASVRMSGYANSQKVTLEVYPTTTNDKIWCYFDVTIDAEL